MDQSSTKRVVGLKYDPEVGLPTVVVKGVGPVAEDMLAATLRTEGPRLVRDPELLERLYRLPTEATIDPALFQVVAAVLSHVFAVNEQLKENAHG